MPSFRLRPRKQPNPRRWVPNLQPYSDSGSGTDSELDEDRDVRVGQLYIPRQVADSRVAVTPAIAAFLEVTVHETAISINAYLVKANLLDAESELKPEARDDPKIAALFEGEVVPSPLWYRDIVARLSDLSTTSE